MSAGAKKESSKMSEHDGSDNWYDSYDIEPKGFPSTVDRDFFGDDSPHKPPAIEVDVKMAADIHITDDQELVENVTEYWFGEYSERFIEVAKVVFNDGSVWCLPLADWDRDYTNTRIHIIEEYIPDVIQWKAITEDRDPSEALEEFRNLTSDGDYSWTEDVDNTEMTDEQRRWFNNNLEHIEHIDRKVKSKGIDVEITQDVDTSWTEGGKTTEDVDTSWTDG